MVGLDAVVTAVAVGGPQPPVTVTVTSVFLSTVPSKLWFQDADQ